MKFWGRRVGRTLVARDEISLGLLEKIPENKDVEIDAKQPRNPQFHRFVFALFGIIAKAFDENPEDVRHRLLVSIGEYREVRFKDGRIDRVPNSLSFAAKDELAFRDFFEKLVRAVYHLYGILPEDTQREITKMLAPAIEPNR